jgi:hypothetical protein
VECDGIGMCDAACLASHLILENGIDKLEDAGLAEAKDVPGLKDRRLENSLVVDEGVCVTMTWGHFYKTFFSSSQTKRPKKLSLWTDGPGNN